ncbi:PREDICTED: 39S ribosomal protein L33, mitochondrial [Dufourea novaeangliae]|uniref:Large ribosomal subunit protein bL33m n=1 Tax=Dufourea novaeangliae TaxID=178035 RepID=A0A154NYT0_DUFNO|nr:PREDICTED: 39S ribosomal protein L33, mitochondrial [Dufourea novaeangliae]KZC04829.1 39S ribosomal protein L33, mitochondrial [Dufourea novaeangliae]
MFLTNILFKKAKSKYILVLMESIASGHKYVLRRERLADKLELERFDPYVRSVVLYRERKKVKSI